MESFDWRTLGRTIVRKVTHNWLLKLGSIAFAIGLWGFVNLGAREADRSISVPVVANLTAAVPAGYRLVESEVRPAVVTVNGPAALVQALRNIPLGPLHLPLTSGSFEETVALERPADVIRLSPDRVLVRGVLEELVITQD